MEFLSLHRVGTKHTDFRTGREVKLNSFFQRCFDMMNDNFFVELPCRVLKVYSVLHWYSHNTDLTLIGHRQLGEANEEAAHKT